MLIKVLLVCYQLKLRIDLKTGWMGACIAEIEGYPIHFAHSHIGANVFAREVM